MRDIELLIRIFLPIYIFVYILVLFVENINSFKKKYNINPSVVTEKDKLLYFFQGYRNKIFFAILFLILFYSIFPGYYYLLVPVSYLEISILRISGIIILIGSLILVRISQSQLKESWRIGIDRSGTKTRLIDTGIYKRSRNPIALGMILNALGLFLVLPNILTFTILKLAIVILNARIIIEEEHLSATHGKKYETYKNKTRKWL